jgi:trimeric autotransporter adhesin
MRLRRPDHATVVAYLALFVALCGSAAAVSGKVRSRDIGKGAVTAPKIRNGAVTGIKIAPGAVGTSALAAGAVGSAQLAPGAVGSTQLAPGAVGTGALAAGAVGSAQLAPEGVELGNLAPGSVSSAKLQDGAVTGSKIAPGAVGTTALGNGAVTAAKVTGPLGLAKSAVAVVEAGVGAGAAIDAGECAEQSVAVPGAQPSDAVLVLPRPTATLPFPGTLATARANNIAGVVNVGICNFSQVDIGDIGAAQPVTIAVFR